MLKKGQGFFPQTILFAMVFFISPKRKKAPKLEKQFIVIGLGRFEKNFTKDLYEFMHSFMTSGDKYLAIALRDFTMRNNWALLSGVGSAKHAEK